jgi:hypothetical protein
MPHSFQPIGSVLQAVVHQHGLTARLFEHQLPQRWADIAGSAIAAQSRPDHIRFRKLYLFVQNSVWLQQLVFLKPRLIEKINEAAGSNVITDIVLRVGDVGTALPAKTTTPQSAQTERAVASLVETPPVHQALTDLQDSSLRDRLANLIASAPLSVPPSPSSDMPADVLHSCVTDPVRVR